ncbi:SDR family oxidoreductase [Nocardia asiatica]|uniref:SDR family oxidoreductase n=1 Tax=Nocardia asiatica TaxID=209252 RepID=UPI001FE06EBB|nr:SDR family oxidoreductase [Nocardia asiatica]
MTSAARFDPVGTAELAVPVPKTVLLTGATGFLGLHLLSELAARTDAEILCPVRAAARMRGAG